MIVRFAHCTASTLVCAQDNPAAAGEVDGERPNRHKESELSVTEALERKMNIDSRFLRVSSNSTGRIR